MVGQSVGADDALVRLNGHRDAIGPGNLRQGAFDNQAAQHHG
jgi:hypothetical protein